MQKVCVNSWCGQPFDVTDADIAYFAEHSPVFGGKKYEIPPPTRCPACRQQQRLSFRNERSLYRRKCDLTGADTVTMFSPANPYPMYAPDVWWSDRFDPLAYGRPVDLRSPFLAQLQDVALRTPKLALTASPDARDMNCDYVNFAGYNKNSYLIFDSDFNEDVSYANVIRHSRNCMDCSYVTTGELCYECVDCTDSYGLRWSRQCKNCSSGAFLFGCTGCTDCAFCCNLANKKHCLWNEQLSPESYREALRKLDLTSAKGIDAARRSFEAFALRFPRKHCSILQSEDSTGDYLTNTQRCRSSFNISDGQDLAYCDSLHKAKDCMDVSSFGEGIERVSNGTTIGHDSYNVHFCFTCVINCSDLFYCMDCRSVKHSFGCVSLKQAEYCILNKQYTKDEYDRCVAEIINIMIDDGEWGDFFPLFMSPFGYNETVAQEYFPLWKEEALARGFQWSDFEPPPLQVHKIIDAADLPDTIDAIPDDVLNWAIRCSATGRPFRITKPELDFYRTARLPVPSLHPDERHRRRMTLRNPRKLWERTCGKCRKGIATSYHPSRPEVVYCEQCYLKEVY